MIFENPKAYAKALKRLARLQRDLSRKVFPSQNWYKAKLKVRLAHRKVADIRSNAIHHLTSYLAKNHGAVVMEDLNVKGLLKNRHLSQALSDAALGMIRTQAEYKCQRYGCSLILADRFFPSSQLCSNCGHRQKMPLSVRVYSCPECGMKKDRDLNASLNLQYIVAGSVTLRSVDGVLPTVPCEADSKLQSSLSSFG